MLVWKLGMPWLGLAGPLIGFVGSVPAWIGRVFPAEDLNVMLPEAREALIGRTADGSGGASQLNESGRQAIDSPPASISPFPMPPPQAPLNAGELPTMAEPESRRQPGATQFSDLVYALGRALGNPASVYQVSELAGLNRGDLEDGFVNAPTRWYAALRIAVESGLEEAFCREALRASPNRELHAAAMAYLG